MFYIFVAYVGRFLFNSISLPTNVPIKRPVPNKLSYNSNVYFLIIRNLLKMESQYLRRGQVWDELSHSVIKTNQLML